MILTSWQDILRLTLTGVLAYGGLIAILRLSGKRTLSKLSAFDFVVTVALGSSLATILLSRSTPLLEGIADAVALLATNDSLLGEEYFGGGGRSASGRDAARGAIRDLDPAARRTPVEVLGPTIRTLKEAKAPGVDVHDAGGVASTIFVDLRAALGRTAAEQLLWTLLRDSGAWRTGGSWTSFAAGLRRAAAATRDERIITEVDARLRAAGLPIPVTPSA